MATELDRLIRKEVSLGIIREPSENKAFIGNTIAPFLSVDADEVVFDYITDTGATGLAPARAEDAESELWMRDEYAAGEGRASVLDWALKNRYSASQVQRYRNDLLGLQSTDGVNFTGGNPLQRSAEKFRGMVLRDAQERRRRLDNRIEWMQVTPLVTGGLSYDDGKVKWSVDYGRPADQTDTTPGSGVWDATTNADFDVIADLLAVKEAHYDKYGVYLTRGIISEKVLKHWYRSSKFRQLGLFGAGIADPSNTTIDLNYIGGGVSPQAAINYVQEQTGITFETYDAAIRTRPFGSKTPTITRFMPEDRVILMPRESELSDIDGTEIGFAKTLTSPHPEGNWGTGFYEWEEEKRDPWQYVCGTGIKAFPVFPYLQYTHTLKVR